MSDEENEDEDIINDEDDEERLKDQKQEGISHAVAAGLVSEGGVGAVLSALTKRVSKGKGAAVEAGIAGEPISAAKSFKSAVNKIQKKLAKREKGGKAGPKNSPNNGKGNGPDIKR